MHFSLHCLFAVAVFQLTIVALLATVRTVCFHYLEMLAHRMSRMFK